MAATNPVVLLAALVKLEAPDGDVRLCDGGILDNVPVRAGVKRLQKDAQALRPADTVD